MKYHSAVIFVKNINDSKVFYMELLEQKIEHDFGKNIIFKDGLSIWEINPKNFISQSINFDNIPNNKFELYFETENINAIENKMISKNIEFVHQIREEPWGQQTIRFYDPDMHLIEVGESLKTFVKRMYSNGMTPEQINEKTSIAINVIKQLLK